MAGDSQSKPSKTTGDQIAGFRDDRHWRRIALDLQSLDVLHGDNEFADMLGLRHVLQRVGDTGDREHAVRKRMEIVAGKALQHFVQKRANAFRAMLN